MKEYRVIDINNNSYVVKAENKVIESLGSGHETYITFYIDKSKNGVSVRLIVAIFNLSHIIAVVKEN
jgi:hypothetical protein